MSPAEDGDEVGEELVLLSPAGTKTHHMRGTEERTGGPAKVFFSIFYIYFFLLVKKERFSLTWLSIVYIKCTNFSKMVFN